MFVFQVVAGVNEERSMLANYKMAHLAILGEVLDDITLEDLRNYFGVKSPVQRFVNSIRNIIVSSAVTCIQV